MSIIKSATQKISSLAKGNGALDKIEAAKEESGKARGLSVSGINKAKEEISSKNNSVSEDYARSTGASAPAKTATSSGLDQNAISNFAQRLWQNSGAQLPFGSGAVAPFAGAFANQLPLGAGGLAGGGVGGGGGSSAAGGAQAASARGGSSGGGPGGGFSTTGRFPNDPFINPGQNRPNYDDGTQNHTPQITNPNGQGANFSTDGNTLRDGLFGAKIFDKSSTPTGISDEDWKYASVHSGHYFSSSQNLSDSMKSFLDSDINSNHKAMSWLYAANGNTVSDVKSGKLEFASESFDFLKNRLPIIPTPVLTMQVPAVERNRRAIDYQASVSKVNEERFQSLAQMNNDNAPDLAAVHKKYGVESYSNHSGDGFYAAAKDGQLLGDVKKTAEILGNLYDKYGVLPTVTASVEYTTSPRGDRHAFPKSTPGMLQALQSQMKYNGLSAGENVNMHLHLIAQGNESNLMQFESSGAQKKLSGGLFGDLNNFTKPGGVYDQAVDLLKQQREEKGLSIEGLDSGKGAQVVALTGETAGHGSPNQGQDHNGTSMDSGVITDDTNFGPNGYGENNDMKDMQTVFSEIAPDAQVKAWNMNTCFGGSCTAGPLHDALDKSGNQKGLSMTAGNRLEGVLAGDGMRNDAFMINQYDTLFKAGDGTPVPWSLFRNQERKDGRSGEENGNIDFTKGNASENVDTEALNNRSQQIQSHQGSSKSNLDENETQSSSKFDSNSREKIAQAEKPKQEEAKEEAYA